MRRAVPSRFVREIEVRAGTGADATGLPGLKLWASPSAFNYNVVAMSLERVAVFCFAASYALALALDLIQVFWPRRVQRLLSLGFGAAGLLAQTLWLAFHSVSLSRQDGSFFFLAWILAVFYFYGSIHHRRVAWGVFVLPLVLGLIAVGEWATQGNADSPLLPGWPVLWGKQFWSVFHYVVLLLGAVGICVGFVASLMYLVKARQLRVKTLPGQGVRLLSLERLEQMNRRAINWAFPLLTIGVLVGAVLLVQGGSQLRAWADPRTLGALLLWLVFALLLYLRYGIHLSGRRLAQLTIVAFVLLVFTLTSGHAFVQGVGP